MPNPRLAARYAKSLIDLAIEKNQLEPVYTDVVRLHAVSLQNPKFVNLLNSPVINNEKKRNIIGALSEGRVSGITGDFVKLLITKNREGLLAEIVNAFLDQYNKLKGIHIVKITTAQPISDDLKQVILKKVLPDLPFENIRLQSLVNEDLIGGFVVEFDNNLVDASVSHNLKEIQMQFMENIYVQQIR